MTIKDNRGYIRVLLHYTTITGWGGPPNPYGRTLEFTDFNENPNREGLNIVGIQRGYKDPGRHIPTNYIPTIFLGVRVCSFH